MNNCYTIMAVTTALMLTVLSVQASDCPVTHYPCGNSCCSR